MSSWCVLPGFLEGVRKRRSESYQDHIKKQKKKKLKASYFRCTIEPFLFFVLFNVYLTKHFLLFFIYKQDCNQPCKINNVFYCLRSKSLGLAIWSGLVDQSTNSLKKWVVYFWKPSLSNWPLSWWWWSAGGMPDDFCWPSFTVRLIHWRKCLSLKAEISKVGLKNWGLCQETLGLSKDDFCRWIQKNLFL